MEWVLDTFGWFYLLLFSGFVLFYIVVAISPFSNLRLGKELRDIAFPTHVNISAIERGDDMISPPGSTVIEAGNFLYILTASDEKAYDV